MNHIPVMLDVSNRKVVIIGGGKIAARKATSLMPHCSNIIAVSAEFSDHFSRLPLQNIVTRIEDIDLNTVIDNNTLVIIATDDPIMNQYVEDLCVSRGILYNRVDDKSSPIIFPEQFDSKGVTVAVSTHGRSPSFAHFLKDILYKKAEGYIKALPVVERLRKDISIRDIELKGNFFRILFDDRKFWNLIASGEFEEAYSLGMELSRNYSGVL